MKYCLFAPTISFWQWLVMCAGIGVTKAMDFSPLSLLVFIGVLVVGAAVEAAVDYKQQEVGE